MRPFFKSGRFVFIENLSPERFIPGDTIYYNSEKSNFIHRISRIHLKPSTSEVEYFDVIDDSSVIYPQKVYPENVIGRPVTMLNGTAGLICGSITNFAFGVIRKIKSYVSRLTVVSVALILSSLFSNLSAATRIKTVEYNFGSYWGTAGATTWTAPSINVNLPESGVAIQNAFVDIEWLTIPTGNTTEHSSSFFYRNSARGKYQQRYRRRTDTYQFRQIRRDVFSRERYK